MKLTLFFLAVALIGVLGLGIMHEQVHVAIFAGYGIDSHVEYFSHFPDFITIADEPCPVEECVLANNINEAITYPLMAFYFMIAMGILMIIAVGEKIVEVAKE